MRPRLVWRGLALALGLTLCVGTASGAAEVLAGSSVEITGNVYCRNADDAVERPLGAVRVFLKQRPDIIAESSAGNGKFRLRVPTSEVVDRDMVLVYHDARFALGEDKHHVSQEDLTLAAGRSSLQLAPRIFVVPHCTDLDAAGLRETVRLAIERMSHRAAVVHSELVRAHASRNAEISACLNDTLSRIGAHLRFAEGRVAPFMDAVGEDPVRARREVTAIKIADERVAELVEEADQCLEHSVAAASVESTQYDPDPLVSPSDLARVAPNDSPQPAPWGRSRPGEALLPTDDDWHFYPGFAFETGYDSNFLQKNKDRGSWTAPAAWQFRPSAHLSMRRYDLGTATRSPATLHSGPVQSADISLIAMLLTSTEAGPQSLGVFSDLGVAANFKQRFGDDSPLGGVLTAKYDRVVEPGIEPENRFAFGTNAIALSAEALMRPGAGRFETGIGYRLGLTYHDDLAQKQYDSVRHSATVRERWLFLPETALVHDTEVAVLTYVGNQFTLNDSLQVRSRLGLAGVVFERFAIEALVGRAEGYYSTARGSTTDFSGFIAHAKLEWFLGPIAERAYPKLALVRPSVAFTFDHDYRDNLTSDYYRIDRGAAELSTNVGERWYLGLHAGASRIAYPRFRYVEYTTRSLMSQPRFNETRLDLSVALEYRIVPRLRFTVTYHYDRNITDKSIPLNPNFPGIPEPAAFRRSRLYGGAIWTF